MAKRRGKQQNQEGPYELSRLKKLWETERLTEVQAIGQILRHLEDHEADLRQREAAESKLNSRVTALEAEVRQLRQVIESMQRQYEKRLAALEAVVM